jgi:hypothetical protein
MYEKNAIYNFYPDYDQYDIYQKVNFIKKDPLGYIKVKDADVWLYEKRDDDGTSGKLYFNTLQKGLFSDTPPLVCWFSYAYQNVFFVYRPISYGFDGVLFMIYEVIDGRIHIKWTKNQDEVTYFKFDLIPLIDYNYVQPESSSTNIIAYSDSLRHNRAK